MLKLIAAAVGYMFGCINSAYYLGRKYKKIDIRRFGSLNAGTSNATRIMGWKIGLFTLLGDACKAIAAIWLIQWIMPNTEHADYYAGAMAVLGHIYPYQLNYKGGKGVATYMGAIFGLSLLPGIYIGFLFILVLIITDYVSIGGIFIFFIGPLLLYFEFDNYEISYLFAIVSFIGISKHRENIMKFRKGENQGLRDIIFKKKKQKLK